MQVRKEVVWKLGKQKMYEDQETGLSIIENDFFGLTAYLLDNVDVSRAGIHVTFAADGGVFLSLNSMFFESYWEKWVSNAERIRRKKQAIRKI